MRVPARVEIYGGFLLDSFSVNLTSVERWDGTVPRRETRPCFISTVLGAKARLQSQESIRRRTHTPVTNVTLPTFLSLPEGGIIRSCGSYVDTRVSDNDGAV